MNPIAFQYKALSIHWYGVLMAAAFFCGYLILQKLAKERDMDLDVERYLVWMIIGILGGARLGEIILYQPLYYLANPIKVFYIWEGGIASHGGMLGGIIAHWWFCAKHKVKFYDLADLAVIPIALGAMFVRLGNFVNGEIVGRVSNVAWAMKFDRFEGLRHPSQLYEAAKNLFLFGVLWNMRRLQLPRGFLFWSFLCFYGILRFFVEFFKEYQTLPPAFGFTMGQVLSIPFVLVSGYMMWRLWKKK
jgi:phosphatidylglycerol---prolipoprotein diacylglyceryl transferase